APTIAGETVNMLDSQLSNELASEAIAKVINTAEDIGQQMDINDAINAATQGSAASIDSNTPATFGNAPKVPLTIANESA